MLLLWLTSTRLPKVQMSRRRLLSSTQPQVRRIWALMMRLLRRRRRRRLQQLCLRTLWRLLRPSSRPPRQRRILSAV
jgi:hypothetical protein